MWCYVCEAEVPVESPTGPHDVLHCGEGKHCVSQAPECGTDMGPGHDHEPPFVCCVCGGRVS